MTALHHGCVYVRSRALSRMTENRDENQSTACRGVRERVPEPVALRLVLVGRVYAWVQLPLREPDVRRRAGINLHG